MQTGYHTGNRVPDWIPTLWWSCEHGHLDLAFLARAETVCTQPVFSPRANGAADGGAHKVARVEAAAQVGNPMYLEHSGTAMKPSARSISTTAQLVERLHAVGRTEFKCMVCAASVFAVAQAKEKWSQCSEGHAMCDACFKYRVSQLGSQPHPTCTICSSPVESVRNRVLEALVGMLFEDAQPARTVESIGVGTD